MAGATGWRRANAAVGDRQESARSGWSQMPFPASASGLKQTITGKNSSACEQLCGPSNTAGYSNALNTIQCARRLHKGGLSCHTRKLRQSDDLARLHLQQGQTGVEKLHIPSFHESQVVIDVYDISAEERRQICYNHLKLGAQPREFLAAVNPYLESVCNEPHEVGRQRRDDSKMIAPPSLIDYVERHDTLNTTNRLMS